MSARDVIISEIRTAPEPVVQEVYDFILSLKGRESTAGPGVLQPFRPA